MCNIITAFNELMGPSFFFWAIPTYRVLPYSMIVDAMGQELHVSSDYKSLGNLTEQAYSCEFALVDGHCATIFCTWQDTVLYIVT